MDHLVLVSCTHSRYDAWGFKYPKKGKVKGPAYGYLWGEGYKNYHCMAFFGADAIWVVLLVNSKNITKEQEHTRFSEGRVVHSGTQKSATDYLLNNGGFGKAIIGATVTVKDYQTAVVGEQGLAVAGNGGTAIAGNNGKAIAGRNGIAISGRLGILPRLSRNYSGTVTAGSNGIIQMKYYYGNRIRIATGYIGEDNLLPNVEYTLGKKNNFIPTIASIEKFGLRRFFYNKDSEYICNFIHDVFSDDLSFFKNNYKKFILNVNKKTKNVIEAFAAICILKE